MTLPRLHPRTRWALGAGCLWICGVLLLAFVFEAVGPGRASPGNWPYDLLRRVSPLARWDSGWYIGIAESGYQRPPRAVGEETNHAFFPLYPLLVRGVVRSTGLETSVAGSLVSCTALLLSLPLLASFVSRRFGEDRVKPTILVLLLFPTSFFLAAVYTEALVLLLALAAVEATERDRLLLAMLAGYLSGLTRITGVVIGPYLFLCSLRRSRETGSRGLPALARAVLIGVSPLLGFGTFCLYFLRKFGDPLLFMRAQHNWFKEEKGTLDGPALLLRGVLEDVSQGTLWRARTLEGLFFLLGVVLVVALLARERRPLEAAYVAMVISLIPFVGTFESAGRYFLPAFPAFAALAGLLHRPHALPRQPRLPLWLAASAAGHALVLYRFVNWRWAG